MLVHASVLGFQEANNNSDLSCYLLYSTFLAGLPGLKKLVRKKDTQEQLCHVLKNAREKSFKEVEVVSYPLSSKLLHSRSRINLEKEQSNYAPERKTFRALGHMECLVYELCNSYFLVFYIKLRPVASLMYLFHNSARFPLFTKLSELLRPRSTKGMVLSADKKKRLADVLSRRNAGGLAPAGPSSPAGAALDRIADKSKRAAPVEVSDDEDTCSGLVFKRKKVGTATEVSSATEGHPSSFREHPPSASSPPEPILTIEGGGESAPSSDQMPSAPELPSLLQRSLAHMPGRAVLEAMDRNSLENLLNHGLGEFLAASNSLLVKGNAEAELLEETAQLKKELEQKDLQLCQATQCETALNQELGSLRQSEKETKKLLFSKGQEAL
ncbi:hypothetical protein VNO80_25201 [Phaseolus coccineus]|uniref:Uncharacterized protein n=1 Tax=Phaseolus coccineus TaxID=3886 RepID=A0AAN9LUD8_PHACN